MSLYVMYGVQKLNVKLDSAYTSKYPLSGSLSLKDWTMDLTWLIITTDSVITALYLFLIQPARS